VQLLLPNCFQLLLNQNYFKAKDYPFNHFQYLVDGKGYIILIS